ncbi:MAG: sulfotransferase [Anaerolineae bacterium]|nr:sulfotransferase [Anaerolineae bacterium]MDK1117747.1 sulfotransferase [Anaerolineae bacterium]
MGIFKNRLQRKASKAITIVSGLPRSGTSMMMKILEAGGMDILTDNRRVADEDNPKGYYELEQVKALKEGDDAWISSAPGKVVKVISSLLEQLPSTYHYKIVFMRREIVEILASQKQMLIRRDEASDGDDQEMAEMFQEHLKRVRVWLANQPNMEVLYVDYNALMADPGPELKPVVEFLNLSDNYDSMLAVPDKKLYRQKAN